MFGDSESENDSETSYPEKENHLQRSSDSFVEFMDVDVEHCVDASSNEKQGMRLLQRQSLNGASDESGIDLESPFRRRALTPYNSTNFDIDDNNYDESFVVPGVDRSFTSTPRTSGTGPGAAKLTIPLNIFKIDLEKVDEAIDKAKAGTAKNNKGRIDFIIQAANPKLERKRGRKSGQEQESYVARPYKDFLNTTFELLFYEKVTYCTDPETDRKTQKIHKIRFLHRTDSDSEEIFALPSGSGRNAVLQWADTNFPSSIASVTLDPKSVTEKEVKNLYENRYLTRCKMKTGESLQTTSEFHLRFAPQIYTKYHANINGANDQLKRVLGHDNESIVKMQVSLESILFPSSVAININQYAELCRKLSEIYSNPNLPRSREFDGYLSKVSKDRSTELDFLLLKELEQFFRLTSRPQCDNVFGKLANFMITQKDSTRYFEAAEFSIYYRNKLMKRFDDRPQLHELHTIVNKNCPSNSLTNFIHHFNALKISTPSPVNGDRIRKGKLFNCLEGVFYDESTENSYWRVSGNWYQVTGKYSFDVYLEYIRVLTKSLLEKRDCSLRLLWPLKEDRKNPPNDQTNRKGSEFALKEYRQLRFVKEGNYNYMYANEPYFTVTDCTVAPFGIEICDLFQYVPHSNGKYTINLYHVKKAFGADGYRVAICQILSGVYLLYDSFAKKRSTDSAAHKLFLFVKEHQKEPIVANYDEFLERLRSATIVFSPLFESGDRELDKEYMSRLRYDFSDFEDCIEPEFREDLEIELESFLLNSEYIHPDKCFTQKWYDACAVRRDRGFDVLNNRGRHVDPFPSRRNLASKKLRRILKEKYYKTVDGLGIKQLIVHMSEVLNFLGFGFKICQIEGAEDELLPG